MARHYLAAALVLVACGKCLPSPDPVVPAPVPVPVVTADAGSGDAGPDAHRHQPKPPAPPPVPSDPYAAACANLAALGCPEATATCAATMRKADVEKLTTVKPSCLAAAKSKAQVHQCGPFARCP
jgi:hypothetical protein